MVLSPAEYDRLRGLNVAEFQAFCDRVGRTAAEQGLTEKKLAQLLADDDAPRARAHSR